MAFDMKIEVVFIGVSDVDRAKDFYVNKLGFNPDQDHTVSDDLRFVQVTPPGSACSVVFGKGVTDTAPGATKNVMMVIDSAQAAYDELTANGIEAQGPDAQPWGNFVSFSDPDGNFWTLQELPDRTGA
jgi:catechol 2,3-dioxygenase-like lactoylglutathione lyase family enzyme